MQAHTVETENICAWVQ